jgi:hypothetical protein
VPLQIGAQPVGPPRARLKRPYEPLDGAKARPAANSSATHPLDANGGNPFHKFTAGPTNKHVATQVIIPPLNLVANLVALLINLGLYLNSCLLSCVKLLFVGHDLGPLE